MHSNLYINFKPISPTPQSMRVSVLGAVERAAEARRRIRVH
jgi:hypothetical protein